MLRQSRSYSRTQSTCIVDSRTVPLPEGKPVELNAQVHGAGRLDGVVRGAVPLLTVQERGDRRGCPLDRPVVPAGGVGLHPSVFLLVVLSVVQEYFHLLPVRVADLHEVDLAALGVVVGVGPQQHQRVVRRVADRRPDAGLPPAVAPSVAPRHAGGGTGRVAGDREYAVAHRDRARRAPALAGVPGAVVDAPLPGARVELVGAHRLAPAQGRGGGGAVDRPACRRRLRILRRTCVVALQGDDQHGHQGGDGHTGQDEERDPAAARSRGGTVRCGGPLVQLRHLVDSRPIWLNPR